MANKENKETLVRNNVAIIPIITARKGSSLKDKNLREYRGKPLLRIAIEKALKVFGFVYVITDSEEYAKKAQNWGAFVPYIEEEIDGSAIPSEQIKRFAVRERLADDDVLVLVQCTAPKTSINTLERAKELIIRKDLALGDCLCAVYEMPTKATAIFSCDYGILKRSLLSGISPEEPRQLLPKLYALAGSVWAFPAYNVKRFNSLYGLRQKALLVSEDESLDIDKESDFLK